MAILQAGQDEAIDAFVGQMILYLRSEFEEVVSDASDEELRQFIRKAVDKAAAYGINDSYLVQQYLTFMAWVGEDFDTNSDTPWAGEILGDKDLAPETKIQSLENYIMTEWEGAI